MQPPAANIKCLPVIPSNWSDLERLFEGRGGPRFCWCMVNRHMTPPYGKSGTAAKKAGMSRYVEEGTPVGILAYIDDEPVAWCSVAPLDSYRNLRGKRYVSDGSDTEVVWSIACFFIRVGFRRQNLTRQLIIAAVNYAREQGAKIIEAYPVDYDSPSYSYMGRVGTFERLGFREVGLVGIRRHMMRLYP